MDAYVYMRIEPGTMTQVLASLATKPQVRRAIAVVGAWDVLAQVEGPDLATIASQVLTDLHHVAGVRRTFTAPVVPPDRVGIAGWGTPQAPGIISDACYVHIKAEPGAAGGLAERLGEMADVAGVAVIGGPYDLLVCVAQPWEVASGLLLEEIHSLPGVVATDTLVSIVYEEPEEDRDQFSSWT
jgi:DNA-binding Lrp family transcriptional regulator